MSDPVNAPAHYRAGDTFEVIKVMEAWLTHEEYVGALKFNIFKYNARHRAKGGDEDLRKAHRYSEILAEFLKRKPTATKLRSVANV